MGALERRLVALEAKAPAQAEDVRITNYAELRAMLQKHVERSLAPKPSGTVGIRHYRDEIAKTRREAEETPTPAPDNPLRTDFQALRIFAAQKDCERNHPGTRHELRRCELEVLAANHFAPDRLATWRAEHEEYAGIPWQWRGDELPADALAVIETALAADPVSTDGEHENDTDAE